MWQSWYEIGQLTYTSCRSAGLIAARIGGATPLPLRSKNATSRAAARGWQPAWVISPSSSGRQGEDHERARCAGCLHPRTVFLMFGSLRLRVQSWPAVQPGSIETVRNGVHVLNKIPPCLEAKRHERDLQIPSCTSQCQENTADAKSQMARLYAKSGGEAEGGAMPLWSCKDVAEKRQGTTSMDYSAYGLCEWRP